MMGKLEQETPIFDGKKPWFPVDFPLNQSIEIVDMLEHFVVNRWVRQFDTSELLAAMRRTGLISEKPLTVVFSIAEQRRSCKYWWVEL